MQDSAIIPETRDRQKSPFSPVGPQFPWPLGAVRLVLTCVLSLLLAWPVSLAEEPTDAARLTDLAAELKHPDEKNRRLAAYELEHFDYTRPGIDQAVEEVVAALSSALRDRDRQVWAHSVRALAHLGPAAAAAVPALMEDLGSRGQEAYRTTYALGRIGAAAVKPLAEALRTGSDDRRLGAARALTWSGPAAAPAIPALIEALLDDSEELRQLASEALGNVGRLAIPPLLAALESEPALARAGAARALGFLGPQASAVVARLLEVVDDPDGSVRAEVLTALRKVGMQPDDLVPLLAAGLEDSDAVVRNAALNSLLKVRPVERHVLPVLVKALESENRQAVLAAAVAMRRVASKAAAAAPPLVTALLQCGRDEREIIEALAGALGQTGVGAAPRLIEAFDDPRAVGDRYVGLTSALAAIGSEVTPSLLDALDHDSRQIRAGVADSLGGVGALHGFGDSERQAVRALGRALSDGVPRVRRSAAEALGKLGDAARPAVRQLVTCARDGDEEVRSAALVALSAIGVETGTLVPLLADALDSESSSLRRASVSAALDLGAEAAKVTAGLIKCLEDGDADVRAGAARALGQIEDVSEEVVTALVSSLEDGDVGVRLAAVESCGRIGPAARSVVTSLVRAVNAEATSAEASAPEDERIRIAAVEALGSVGPSAAEAWPALEAALERGSTKLRAQAATSLGLIGTDPRRIVSVMVKALEEDDESEVRRAVVDVLGKIGPDAQDAVPALFQMMDRRYESRIAYEALKQIRPRSVPLLRDALRHRSGFVRSLAAESLGQLGAEAREAIPDLRELLEDRDVDRRLEGRLREALEDILAAVEKEEKAKKEPAPKLRVF